MTVTMERWNTMISHGLSICQALGPSLVPMILYLSMQIYIKTYEYIISVLRMLLKKQVGYRIRKWG